jgi:hypothetical protein
MLALVLGLLLASAPPEELGLARRALAQELGVREDLIQLRSSRRGRWFDANLGCPGKPVAARRLTNGRELVLSVDGREYQVHVAGRRAVVCAAEHPARAQGAAVEPAARKVVELAREDLAARLQIGVEAIETRAVHPMNWPDSSLGCPQPGFSYMQMITPGYRIELQADGRRFSYHSDQRRVIACEGVGRLGPGLVQPAPGEGPVDR